MKTYDFKGRLLNDSPKIVYRGLDLYKDNRDNLIKLEELFSRGNIPSKALLIKEGTFDFEKAKKNETSWMPLNKNLIDHYLRMLEDKNLNPLDCNNDLRIQNQLYYPVPFVSTSTDPKIAAMYSHWVKSPVLVFRTDDLEGIDHRKDHACNDSEVVIFKKIPLNNLINIIYFYENPKDIRTLLKKHKRKNIPLIKGFTRPDFRYKTCSGDFVWTDIPSRLKYEEDFIEFYNKLEKEILNE